MEFTPEPQDGRIFVSEHWNLLSDCDPLGRLRLDGLARILHNAATLDNESSPAADKGLWILRRVVTRLSARPRYLDAIETRTWCSGLGRAWAERRTDLYHNGDRVAKAKALWVNVAPATGFPRSLPDGFLEVFGPSANGRNVKPRFELSVPKKESSAVGSIPLRYSDLDIVDHVNNAIHLALAEDILAPTVRGTASQIAPYNRVTVEFHDALQLPDPADWQVWHDSRSTTLHLSQAGVTASVVLLEQDSDDDGGIPHGLGS